MDFVEFKKLILSSVDFNITANERTIFFKILSKIKDVMPLEKIDFFYNLYIRLNGTNTRRGNNGEVYYFKKNFSFILRMVKLETDNAIEYFSEKGFIENYEEVNGVSLDEVIRRCLWFQVLSVAPELKIIIEGNE